MRILCDKESENDKHERTFVSTNREKKYGSCKNAKTLRETEMSDLKRWQMLRVNRFACDKVFVIFTKFTVSLMFGVVVVVHFL